MSTHPGTQSRPSIPSSRRAASRRQPLFPEGAIVPALHVGLIALAAFSVERSGWTNLVIPVGLIGLTAALFGTLIAKLRVMDSLAHLLSIAAGIGLVFGLVLAQAESLGDGLRARVKPLAVFLFDWYLGKRPPDEQEALLISMLMGLIVWLVCYLATWILLRRGWLFTAIALPGFLLLVNMGYAPEPRPWLLGVFASIAIPLAARYALYQRQQSWARSRMVGPQGLASRLLIISTVVALVLTGASWQAPQAWSGSILAPIFARVSETFVRSQQEATSWLENASGGSAERPAGAYTAFDDAFSIGGPLQLSDQPEVLVQTDSGRAPYLTAYRYDVYDGRGWSSSIDDEFNNVGADGQRYAPELTFREGQEVVLSGNMTADRTEQATTITPLNSNTDVVYSVDTFLSADIRTAVRMSWRQLVDEQYPVSRETLASLPPDLQGIASLLVQSDLDAGNGPKGPQAADPANRAAIDAERGRLASRFLDVRWTASPDGVVQALFVTGQMPVYDDVEAVFVRETPGYAAGSPYEVTSLTSLADPAALASAGTDYPSWVADRYLQMGETVTPRTIQLAMDLTAGSANPYEKAVVVEQYLRSSIVYDEKVSEPPNGADVVDYVLFEDSRGYCVYYASSMTVMMRALGIPAQTVVGYYPGEFDEAQDGYVYRQRNAHAWTEVFFPGYGWIPFEPTASRPLPNRDASAAAPQVLPTVAPTVEPTPTVAAEAPATPMPGLDDIGGGSAPQLTSVADGQGNRRSWLLPLMAVVAVGAAGGGVWWLSWSWRLRRLAPSAALFERLRRVGRWLGVTAQETTTPREYADALARRVPAAGKPARQIVHVYELDQFGPQGADQRLLTAASEAWRRMRGQIPKWLLHWRQAR